MNDALHMFGRELTGFNWLEPDYGPIWDMRITALAKLTADPVLLEVSREFYASDPAAFIGDWGVTMNPNNVGTSIPAVMPFLLFPRQVEFIQWLDERRRTKDSGVLVKSRDCGASWLAMAYACWLCIFHRNAAVGFGSHKQEQVDNAADTGTLFYKGRKFMSYLPKLFKQGWDENLKSFSGERKMMFPWNEGTIMGRSGDNIGVGDRTTLFIVDEFAAVERSKLVEANLIATSECRIEMSTVKGLSNVFAEHARGGKMSRFDFHYRDDPRKCYRDEHGAYVLHAWFAKKKASTDPIIWNEQYECDFLASAEGIVIPQEWVVAAVGAHSKLGIVPSGVKRGAYDVADRGIDKNCYGSRHGVLLRFIQSWSGEASDIFASTERSFRLADQLNDEGFNYDGDGMGAAVRGDSRKIIEARETKQMRKVAVDMFRGSGAILDPDMISEGTDRTNLDFFENYKAQSWWALRRRFNLTWRAVTGVLKAGEYDPSAIISIDPDLPEKDKTMAELSQPVWKWSKSGKMMIDKTPDDVSSPNNADTVMMLFPYGRPPMKFDDELFNLL